MKSVDVSYLYETDRLKLMRFEKNHAIDLFHLIRNNRDRLKRTGVITDKVYNFQTTDDSDLYIKQMQTGWILKNLYAFGIWKKDNNELIGEYKIFNIDWRKKNVETGRFLDYKNEGRFFAQEADSVITKMVFEGLSIEEMHFSCRKDNIVERFANERSKFSKKIRENNMVIFFVLTKAKYLESIQTAKENSKP